MNPKKELLWGLWVRRFGVNVRHGVFGTVGI